jgi:hypothetical protein
MQDRCYICLISISVFLSSWGLAFFPSSTRPEPSSGGRLIKLWVLPITDPPRHPSQGRSIWCVLLLCSPSFCSIFCFIIIFVPVVLDEIIIIITLLYFKCNFTERHIHLLGVGSSFYRGVKETRLSALNGSLDWRFAYIRTYLINRRKPQIRLRY